jgi:anti-sigma B factor antagonist
VAPATPSYRHDPPGAAHRDEALIPRPRPAGQDDARVVQVAGELDSASNPSLRARLTEAVAGRPRAILVDATAVTFCSAGSLSALLSAADDARAAGVPFAVYTRAPAILRPVRLLGLGGTLLVHRDPADVHTWLDTADHAGPRHRRPAPERACE